MKYLNHLICILAFVSMYSTAFEFNNSSAPYDFSQTAEIFIVDQNNEKFFGMFDPFEMKMTTVPSRFYVSVMGAVERGHRNAEGVIPIEGAISDHEYVLIFRSLNRSHVLFIGTNWIVDGNKKIHLSPEEVIAIYELLLQRSNGTQATDLKKLEGLFEEINNQQTVSDDYAKVSTDDELKSIIESKKTIEERLPAGHDDSKTLPYYNKALENQKFFEELEKEKKLENTKITIETSQSDKVIIPIEESSTKNVLTDTLPVITSTTDEQKNSLPSNKILLGVCFFIGIVFLCFIGFKRRAR